MITSLHLLNFKPFANQSLEFKKLTLFSGLNSTGKSSVMQSLLLLRQSYQQGLLPEKGLALNGYFVNIGTARDALFEGAKEDLIGFGIVWENNNKATWRFKYDREVDVLNIDSEPVSSEVYKSNLFGNNFHYLQAERLGPRPFNEMSDYQVRQLGQLGIKGEYAAHFLAINGEKIIPNSSLSHPEVKLKTQRQKELSTAKSMDLIDQVEAWMGEISPGTRLKIDAKSDVDLMSFQYSYGDSNPYRATNVGFGISYTLPIIVAALASTPGTIILIENPEAHLHPKGQVKMGELLALAASGGVQVVIETHSDHVLNGIRLAVHGGKLDPKNVQLHYFQRQNKEGQAVTNVVSPKIDRNGRIDRWPDGFFDEWDNSLEILLEPAVEGE
ncbi:AAA family ATPase [Microcoleus sp. herbarium12]|uniref:AAA family ATPase n=1 Tax=Microcoleus sp. herbarium12 TaxID=3055437 RepID=UPI002FD0F672